MMTQIDIKHLIQNISQLIYHKSKLQYKIFHFEIWNHVFIVTDQDIYPIHSSNTYIHIQISFNKPALYLEVMII